MAESDSQLSQGSNQQDSQQENSQGKNPQEGAWNNIETGERPPKVEFEFNKPVQVVFSEDFEKPKEFPNKGGDGVFYVFNVFHEGQKKAIVTSAWSLLRGLKENSPLAGKTIKILKSMVDGKQNYSVEDVTPAKPSNENKGSEQSDQSQSSQGSQEQNQEGSQENVPVEKPNIPNKQ